MQILNNLVNNLPSEKTACATVSSAAVGLITLAVTDLAARHIVPLSFVSGFLASVGSSVLDPDSRSAYKAAAAAGVTFAVFGILYSSGPLQTLLGVVLEPQSTAFLAAANITGQVVSFPLGNKISDYRRPVSPHLGMAERDVRKFHAACTANAELFSGLRPLLQIDLARRFKSCGLPEIKPPPDFIEDVVKNLDAGEVTFLFGYKEEQGEGQAPLDWTVWTSDEGVREALMGRFLEAQLFDDSFKGNAAFQKVVQTHELPRDLEKINAYSDTARQFYYAMYGSCSATKEAWQKLKSDVQWALFPKSSNGPFPLLLTISAGKIRDEAPEDMIKWLAAHPDVLNWIYLKREEQEAFIARFPGCSIATADYHCCPKDENEVANLPVVEIEEYYAAFCSESGSRLANSMPDKVICALLARIYALEADCDPSKISVKILGFENSRIKKWAETFLKEKESDMEKCSVKDLSWLHALYTASRDMRWEKIADGKKVILNKRFELAQPPLSPFENEPGYVIVPSV